MCKLPTWAEAVEAMKLGDNGFLFILFCITYAAICLYWLARKHPRFANALEYTPILIPLVAALASPAIGIFAGILVLCGSYIALPQKNALWLILGAALAFRLPLLFNSLWYDESFTSRLIHLPLENLPAAIMADVHPPAYYLLLWPLAQITRSPELLRLPSLLLGLLAIVMVYRLVVSFGLGERIALITAALWAVLPAAIYYSAELRSYELIVAIVLALLLTIIGNKPRWFAALLALLCWTHNVGFLYAGVIGLGGMLYHHNRRWLLAVIIGGLVGALWLPFMLQQAQNIGNGHWAHFSAGVIFWPLLNMTVGTISQDFIPIVVVIILGLIAISIMAIREWALWTGRGLLWLGVVFGVPVLAATISALWKPMYVYRHFLPCMLLMTISWAYVLNKSRLARALVIPTIGLALISFYRDALPLERTDFRALLADSCASAENAYATSINAAFIVSENSNLPITVWPRATDNGQTVEAADITDFAYPVGELPERACILQIDIPATKQAERDYLAELLAQRPHQTTKKWLGNWLVYYIHELK